MLRFSEIWFMALCLQIAVCRPSEEPTKFSLNDFINPIKKLEIVKENTASKFEQGMELLGSMADKIRFGRGRLVNSIILARNNFKERGEDWVNQIKNTVSNDGGGLINSAISAKDNIINQTEEIASDTQNSITSLISPKIDSLSQEKTSLPSYEKAPFASILPPKTRETVRLESESDQALFEKPKSNPFEGILQDLLRPTPIVDGITEKQKYGNSGDKFIGIGRAIVNGFEGLSNFLNRIVDFPIKAAKQTTEGITEALNQLGARLIGLQ